jgi:hypothetical protein
VALTRIENTRAIDIKLNGTRGDWCEMECGRGMKLLLLLLCEEIFKTNTLEERMHITPLSLTHSVVIVTVLFQISPRGIQSKGSQRRVETPIKVNPTHSADLIVLKELEQEGKVGLEWLHHFPKDRSALIEKMGLTEERRGRGGGGETRRRPQEPSQL